MWEIVSETKFQGTCDQQVMRSDNGKHISHARLYATKKINPIILLHMVKMWHQVNYTKVVLHLQHKTDRKD